ncbi:MAG: (Fe-S)-binding protein [Candidatus Helarchaeales archaeon]
MVNDEHVYFRGCTLAYTQPEEDKLIAKILEAAGISFSTIPDEPCCGGELLRRGASKEFEKKVKKNISRFKELNVKKIITYCPECHVTLKIDYPKVEGSIPFEVFHFTEIISFLLKNNTIQFTKPISIAKNITYHDGCHLGREAGLYEPPRFILKSIPGMKFKEMPLSGRFSLCCGGPIRMSHVELRNQLVERIFLEAKKKAKAKGDGGIVTPCPTCYYNFKMVALLTESNVKPINMIRLIAYELGIIDEWKDPELEE